MKDTPDWKKIAADLAWSMTGMPHTLHQQKALDKYDESVITSQRKDMDELWHRRRMDAYTRRFYAVAITIGLIIAVILIISWLVS